MTELKVERLAASLLARMEKLSAEDFQEVMNEIRWLRQQSQKPSPFDTDQPVQETLF